MVALLIAQATQAVTPDVASLSSPRLFQIVSAVSESGKTRLTPCLHEGCLAIHTEKSLPPNGSAPFEDRGEENASDEVCLASQHLAPQLTVGETGSSHNSYHVSFETDMHSGRLGSSSVSDPVPCSSVLIHSLCRMTC
jgi:hypothetical protein